MADIVDARTRSRMMSCVKSRNTKPEMILRRWLHARGFRYRLHVRKLPGCPDLVLPRYRAVILIHGCFWHRHEGCRFATTPQTRSEYWANKFQRNVNRDRDNHRALLEAGWRVATVWECALRHGSREELLAALAGWLKGEQREFSSDVVVAPM
ncbi:very short patch repair endonuclease [Guyparkeria hydrothermalis]|uniref:very short patch repair endonuclease n=1 Tax=Guyparkeria hydrothermalis TaxID=923 RepID=UPI002020BE1E|nr:very short patch repair endonuclease [Guyparkeria hydrothermalis]